MSVNTVWLHGLESAPGGYRVDHLNKLGNCYAPEMDYTKEGAFCELVDAIAVLPVKPDYLIGSSMGGYYAYHAGRILSIPTLLFNPALPYRTNVKVDEAVSDNHAHPVHHLVYCGSEDRVIDPNATFEWLRNRNEFYTAVLVDGMAHRTDNNVFLEAVKRLK